MQFVATFLFAFLLLVFQSVFAHLSAWDLFMPNAALAVVLFMGLHDHDLGSGAVLSFAIGYMMDAFSGSPIGLCTFMAVSVFLISRVAALRLFLQSWIFEIFIVLLLSLVAGAIILLIRALFDQDFDGLLSHLKIVVWRAATTSMVAPAVFRGMRRIEQLSSRGGRSSGRKVYRS